MTRTRLEAFSDGVLAILITIMVLELKVPHGTSLAALADLLPVFYSYVLSFVNIGIYWSNHHHLMHTVERVDGRILWANLHLMFWLSLLPFATAWMGENEFAAVPTAVYGIDLLACGAAYYILQRVIVGMQGPSSKLAAAIGRDLKGKLSPVAYVVAVASCFVSPWIAQAIYLMVAVMWIVPDRRIERQLEH